MKLIIILKLVNKDIMVIDEFERSKYLNRHSLFKHSYAKYFIMEMNYRKTPCPVPPPLSSPPLKLSKSWSLAKILV